MSDKDTTPEIENEKEPSVFDQARMLGFPEEIVKWFEQKTEQ